MTNLDWAEKYRPQTLSEVAGHKKALAELKQWAQQWEKGHPDEKAVVLYGKPGTGKTTSAHALAKDMGWEAIELNASDQRTADIIEKVAGSALQNSTLEGKDVKRLVIMDEADNIHGTADRGGERTIIGLISKTNQPIILIANELYDMSVGPRNACRPIQFSAVTTRSMLPVLKKISDSDGIEYNREVLEKLAQHANGDVRSAINDMQAAAEGKSTLQVDEIVTGDRDTKENIFKIIVKILKGTNINDAYSSTFNLDENPEDLIQWVDENLPLEYKSACDLQEGYRCLSRASVFLGRVRIRQNYAMWKYATVMMTAGIVVSRSERYKGFTKYQSPSLWRKLGQTKSLRKIRDATARKIGSHCHVSMSFTRAHLFPFFRNLMNHEEYAPKIAAILKLEPDEIAFLVGSKSTTRKVQKIYAHAQSLIERETEHEIEVFGGFGVESSEKSEANNVRQGQSTLFDF